MKLEIQVENDILHQFSQQLKVKKLDNSLKLDAAIGTGSIVSTHFPNTLELHHFNFTLKQEIQISSDNAKDSAYLLLNINLSETQVEKEVNGQVVSFQKYLPSGILFYPPNIKVSSISPKDTPFEIVLIKFHKDLLSTYFQKEAAVFFQIKDTVVYEDLDLRSEEVLRTAIDSDNKLKSHAYLLDFLAMFFDKLSHRGTEIKYESIHPQDIKHLFLAASLLRNPTPAHTPSISELAEVANMGKTKFKNTFKQVFGSAPKQYHQKIRMDYAKEQLQKKQKTPTQLAYELGYAHPSKFTRAFKNHFGDLPSSIL